MGWLVAALEMVGMAMIKKVLVLRVEWIEKDRVWLREYRDGVPVRGKGIFAVYTGDTITVELPIDIEEGLGELGSGIEKLGA